MFPLRPSLKLNCALKRKTSERRRAKRPEQSRSRIKCGSTLLQGQEYVRRRWRRRPDLDALLDQRREENYLIERTRVGSLLLLARRTMRLLLKSWEATLASAGAGGRAAGVRTTAGAQFYFTSEELRPDHRRMPRVVFSRTVCKDASIRRAHGVSYYLIRRYARARQEVNGITRRRASVRKTPA